MDKSAAPRVIEALVVAVVLGVLVTGLNRLWLVPVYQVEVEHLRTDVERLRSTVERLVDRLDKDFYRPIGAAPRYQLPGPAPEPDEPNTTTMSMVDQRRGIQWSRPQ